MPATLLRGCSAAQWAMGGARRLFRARWLFQLGVVYHGWNAYGTEPWFSWAQVEDFLTRSLAEL